jgi:hypothetical protein
VIALTGAGPRRTVQRGSSELAPPLLESTSGGSTMQTAIRAFACVIFLASRERKRAIEDTSPLD